MGDDADDDQSIVPNLKIKTPGSVNAGLPQILRLVVLLGAKRGVMQVVNQKTNLFIKGSLNRWLQVVVVFPGTVRVLPFHRLRVLVRRVEKPGPCGCHPVLPLTEHR